MCGGAGALYFYVCSGCTIGPAAPPKPPLVAMQLREGGRGGARGSRSGGEGGPMGVEREEWLGGVFSTQAQAGWVRCRRLLALLVAALGSSELVDWLKM